MTAFSSLPLSPATLAKVAAKNLSHVRKMMETRKSRGGVDPHWLDDPGEGRR